MSPCEPPQAAGLPPSVRCEGAFHPLPLPPPTQYNPCILSVTPCHSIRYTLSFYLENHNFSSRWNVFGILNNKGGVKIFFKNTSILTMAKFQFLSFLAEKNDFFGWPRPFFDHFFWYISAYLGCSASQVIYAGIVLFPYFESTKWYAQTFFKFFKKSLR